MGLYLGELIFGGTYCWREFCVSKWVGLDNKNGLKQVDNSQKQLKTANPNSPWACIWEGLLSERYFAPGILEAYYQKMSIICK